MTASELVNHLTVLMANTPGAAEAQVMFGPDGGSPVPIEGGITGYARGQDPKRPSRAVILAPCRLNEVGGF